MSSHQLVLASALLGGALFGCARDALDEQCPTETVGDLVVTEVRGNQSGTDGYDEWIEVYNASGRELDLEGLEIVVQRVDGGASGTILVRQSLLVGAGAYAVIGRVEAGREPDYMDYGYKLPCESSSSGCGDRWLDTAPYDAAAIDLISCGILIDRTIYRNLPSRGTWALDGTEAPSASANDDESTWCIDDNEDANTETQGIRGTPGAANIMCPQ